MFSIREDGDGLRFVHFRDYQNRGCVVAESYYTPGTMWLGTENAKDQMQLTPEIAAQLWPVIKQFSETNRMPPKERVPDATE